jgi:2-polyprenyl-3-methyl-5-hydroxy-6-metoxy-1,4-benzoquinol methylase
VSATATATWRELACPRDRARLELRADSLVCAQGHEYPYVDGIPVLVVDDELAPTQPGYWAKPEQIERVRAAVPPPVEGEAVDPYVSELILGTHGNLYKHLSAGISRYPIPDFPLARGDGELLLDIGCNWGRWTIAAARAGYRPLGIDPSFEAVVAARRIATQLGVEARYLVADARRLPFATETFDVVFSYGVLQHFSKADVADAVDEIRRVLKPTGFSWVQMPNALGLLNIVRLAQRRFREGSHFEVRYWRPAELRRVFGRIGATELSTDGFFTLNPQKRDLDLLPRRFRTVVRASEALKRAGAPTTFADSVNVRSVPR